MLTSETKNKLNSVKNVLVGKIPDPKGQVDQITNALIYKFMDDQDRLSMSVPGGKASFFVGELEEFAWHKLFDSKLSNQDRADLYIKGLDKLSTATKLPELFRDIFKNAYLPFRAPDTIAMFLDVINTFDYHHPEELGNAFEHLLSIMGSQGDAGQFRTPRHIIEFIVKVVAPKKDETIFDPACGTAGFLVEAFNQIKNSSKLTPQELQLLANNIEGFDIDPGMAKLARVNLYLHGFKTPHITENDTLTNENLWLNKKYDVILANPPFMSPKGGIKPHDKFSVKANKSEVLFVNYIAEHLKLHGRAGIIVPEGIIFSSGGAYKQLRKTLVEDGYLSAVVSLPSGVFNPYAGVKTSILVLDRERAKNSDEILFVKVENDGYDLGAQRRPINKNDLPEALDVLEKWQSGEKVESKLSSFISKEKIVESDDYNLLGDRYNTITSYTNTKWPMVDLGDICKFTQGVQIPKEDQINEYRNGYKRYLYIQDFKGESKSIFVKDNYASKELTSHDLVMANTGTPGRAFIAVPGILSNNLFRISFEKNTIYQKYLFYILESELFQEVLQKQMKGGIQKHLGHVTIANQKIPLPPLEIQEQIVAELDGYQKIIDGAKQVVENWKPKIDINPEWKKVKLGEVVVFVGGYAFKSDALKDEKLKEFDLTVVKIGNVGRNGEVEIEKAQYASYEDSLKKFLIYKDDILIAMTGATVGKVAISQFDNLLLNQRVGLVRPDKEKLLKHFLRSILFSDEFYHYCQRTAGGGAQGNISPDQIKEYFIPLPSLEVQKEIVEKIESEKLLVESNKKLIEIYEQKMKDVISKLFNHE